MSVKFEWNKEKVALNFRKQGVSFDEACTVFIANFNFNYRKARPNRFAAHVGKSHLVVLY